MVVSDKRMMGIRLDEDLYQKLKAAHLSISRFVNMSLRHFFTLSEEEQAMCFYQTFKREEGNNV